MIRAVLAGIAALLLAGCGYHLAGQGDFLPEHIEIIGVPPLENETQRAELGQRASEELLDEFLKRGYKAVARRETTHAVLEGSITGYHRVPVSFSARGRATREEITITARVRLVETEPEHILWSQENFVFRGQYDIEERNEEFFNREILAIEEIAQDFAEAVVTSIVEGF